MDRQDVRPSAFAISLIALAAVSYVQLIRNDEFADARTEKYLGVWKDRQPLLASIRQVTPVSPFITATLRTGFCNHSEIVVTRLPVNNTGRASWATLFGIFHEADANIVVRGTRLEAEKQEWTTIKLQKLTSEGGAVGIPISRTTFINLMLLTNARMIFEYADASGYRASYPSMCGQWYINRARGGPAVASLRPHDSHSVASDVYPPSWPARLDRCVQMMAGVVVQASNPDSFSIGFPGLRPPGQYVLEFQEKGFAGSHGSRHIYNMNGGEVYNVDFLFMRSAEAVPLGATELVIPSTVDGQPVKLHVPTKEQECLANALDLLPWAWISWSIHRGLKAILVAYAKPIMDLYRNALAKKLKDVAKSHVSELEAQGWNREFVESRIGDLAASSVRAGQGNSADMVRIVSDLARVAFDGSVKDMDETHFWQN